MQDDKNKIDEIFRNALKDSKQEPSDYIWENIELALPRKGFFNSSFSKLINIAAGIIILSVLTFTAYYFYNNQKSNVSSKVVIRNNKDVVINNKANINNSDNSLKQTKNQIKQSSEVKANEQLKPANNLSENLNNNKTEAKAFKSFENKKLDISNPVITDKSSLIINNKKLSKTDYLSPDSKSNIQSNDITAKENKIIEANNTEIITQTPENKTDENTLINNIIQPISNIANSDNNKSETASDSKIVNTQSVLPNFSYIPQISNKLISTNYNPSDYDTTFDESHIYDKLMHRKNHPDIYLGLSYTPEYYISRSDFLSTKKDFAHSSDLSLTFVWNQFYLRTGLGISLYRTDKFNYQINYFRNEVVGSYNQVDSVTFKVEDNIIVPEFHTTQVSVSDEVNHSYKSQINNKYAYIQIPLIFGYKLNEMKNVSFSLNCGPVISMTLLKKTNDINYPKDGAKITDVNINEVSRVNSYMDMLLSLGMNYRINSRFSFNLEPQLRTGVSKVYSSSNPQTQKPYSIGLRTGIMYKL